MNTKFDHAKKYMVNETILSCRNHPWVILETKDKTYVSRVVKKLAYGKIVKVYALQDGYMKISRFRNHWVKCSGLTEV